MLTRPSFRPALVVGVVVVATAWFATRAGDLNPPKGPIQPTLVSLEDLYNRIGTQGDCPTCAWSYKFVNWSTSQSPNTLIVAGSGVLHAVYQPAGQVTVYDHNGQGAATQERAIARTLAQGMIVFDVRFANGLYVSGLGETDGSSLTLLYRLDP